MADSFEEEIVYDGGKYFSIKDMDVCFYSEEVDSGLNTVIAINVEAVDENDIPYTYDEYYYLGDQPPTIETAVNFWQEFNDCILFPDEIKVIMKENNLT